MPTALLYRHVEAALQRFVETHGEPASFWLRDDDAVSPSPRLDRLIASAERAGAPLALAVIPQGAGAPLTERLADVPGISVLQHGWSHENHAGAGEKKSEFPPSRDRAEAVGDIARGWERLAGALAIPVFVPPWNRIAPGLAEALGPLGYRALSVHGDRRAPDAAPGLLAINTHIDPVDWHETRGFLGRDVVLSGLAARIERLVDGRADRLEPTGILTHHLVHDEAIVAFLDEILEFIAASPFCRWLSVRDFLMQDLPHDATRDDRNAAT